MIRRFRYHLVRHQADWVETATPEWRIDPVQTLAAEVIPLADACRFLEKEAGRWLKPKRLGRDGRPVWLAGTAAEVHREPLGWVMILAPSNYPLMLPGVQVLQALAAGNSVALKPSPLALPAAQKLVATLHDCGVPMSALRLLDTDPASARALYGQIDKLVLTGSRATGLAVQRDLAEYGVPSVMELSGVDAMVVLPGANLELVTRAIGFGLGYNASATCIAPRRIMVVGDSARLVERLPKLLGELPSTPLHPGGSAPLKRLIEKARELGGEVIGDAKRFDVTRPLVVTGVPQDHGLFDEDLMAPVAVVTEVGSVMEAVAAVNRSSYGLGASVFGPMERAQAVAARLDVGVVTVNDVIVPTADPRLPFSGRRDSGFGVTRGGEGLLEMTRVKVVTRRGGRKVPIYLDPGAGNPAAALPALFDFSHGPTWRHRLAGLLRLIRSGRGGGGSSDDGDASR